MKKNDEDREDSEEVNCLDDVLPISDDFNDPVSMDRILIRLEELREEEEKLIECLETKLPEFIFDWPRPWYQRLSDTIARGIKNNDPDNPDQYRSDHFTLKESKRLSKNWKRLIKLHKIPNEPSCFARWRNLGNKKKNSNKEKIRTYITAFLAQGLQRTLTQVYKHFVNKYAYPIKGPYSEDEEKIMRVCFAQKPDQAVLILSAVLRREPRGIYKRQNFYENGRPERKRVKWNLDLADKFIKSLMKHSELSLEELKGTKFDSDVWHKVESDMDIPHDSLRKFFFRKLHMQLFVEGDVKTVKIRRKIFKILKNSHYQVWRDIRWNEILDHFPEGYTSVFLHYLASRSFSRNNSYLKTPLSEVAALAKRKLKLMANKCLKKLTIDTDGNLKYVKDEYNVSEENEKRKQAPKDSQIYNDVPNYRKEIKTFKKRVKKEDQSQHLSPYLNKNDDVNLKENDAMVHIKKYEEAEEEHIKEETITPKKKKRRKSIKNENICEGSPNFTIENESVKKGTSDIEENCLENEFNQPPIKKRKTGKLKSVGNFEKNNRTNKNNGESSSYKGINDIEDNLVEGKGSNENTINNKRDRQSEEKCENQVTVAKKTLSEKKGGNKLNIKRKLNFEIEESMQKTNFTNDNSERNSPNEGSDLNGPSKSMQFDPIPEQDSPRKRQKKRKFRSPDKPMKTRSSPKSGSNEEYNLEPVNEDDFFNGTQSEISNKTASPVGETPVGHTTETGLVSKNKIVTPRNKKRKKHLINADDIELNLEALFLDEDKNLDNVERVTESDQIKKRRKPFNALRKFVMPTDDDLKVILEGSDDIRKTPSYNETRKKEELLVNAKIKRTRSVSETLGKPRRSERTRTLSLRLIEVL